MHFTLHKISIHLLLCTQATSQTLYLYIKNIYDNFTPFTLLVQHPIQYKARKDTVRKPISYNNTKSSGNNIVAFLPYKNSNSTH